MDNLEDRKSTTGKKYSPASQIQILETQNLSDI